MVDQDKQREADIVAFRSWSKPIALMVTFIGLLTLLAFWPIMGLLLKDLKNKFWIFPAGLSLLTVAHAYLITRPTYRGFIWLYARANRTPRQLLIALVSSTLVAFLLAAFFEMTSGS